MCLFAISRFCLLRVDIPISARQGGAAVASLLAANLPNYRRRIKLQYGVKGDPRKKPAHDPQRLGNTTRTEQEEKKERWEDFQRTTKPHLLHVWRRDATTGRYVSTSNEGVTMGKAKLKRCCDTARVWYRKAIPRR